MKAGSAINLYALAALENSGYMSFNKVKIYCIIKKRVYGKSSLVAAIYLLINQFIYKKN